MSPQPTATAAGVLRPRALLSGRRALLFGADLAVLAGAFLLAWMLRFDFTLGESAWGSFLRQLPMVLAVQIVALFATGIPLFVWRYVSTRELFAFASAAAFATIPLLVLRIVLPDDLQAWRTPVSITLMDAMLGFGGLLGIRVWRRLVWERAQRAGRERHADTASRVLLAGAGRAGVLAVREIAGRRDVALDVVGFIDDDPLKHGMVIQGIRVLGTIRDMPRLARELHVNEAIFTVAAATPGQLRRFTEACAAAGLQGRSVPGFYELLQGDVKIDRFRPIRPEDLLLREPINLMGDHVRRMIAGKVVMVTGSGGSIGAELARQVAAAGPEVLVLVERAEFALFAIDREIRDRWQGVPVKAVVADVGDRRRMQCVFGKYSPAVVIHAAAHKHVPLMEDNAAEAVRNNVLATHTLALLAGEFQAECFVLISTDKAVRPTSVMGATKRMAELVIQDLNDRFDTAYVAVRFGNVLGSMGSVIPIFEEQIRNGGPVTVTHPEMKRYFMTIPEAVQLVLEAGSMGEGGEIFVLDMGDPVAIVDLAERMIRIHGYEPHRDIAIEFIGARAGEKLHEELGHAAEELSRTRNPKIYIGQIPTMPRAQIERALVTLDGLVDESEPDAIHAFMNAFLHGAGLGAESPASLARG